MHHLKAFFNVINMVANHHRVILRIATHFCEIKIASQPRHVLKILSGDIYGNNYRPGKLNGFLLLLIQPHLFALYFGKNDMFYKFHRNPLQYHNYLHRSEKYSRYRLCWF